MLPPFIIEEIRKREREEQSRHDAVQPRLELPIPGHGRRDPSPPSTKPEDEGRGVIVIDL